ncbi:hypothetical protein BCR33DRAFT_654798 [Rhizoclosmatium globosum]|uniref:Transmembrane protein 198 n=1 Tax=Rhizoclosmatium globosum TaxID=329046 RepID=A0A1Y2D2X7_9FUNG|nr:hypothetical protein BCR33DRAFT_654798 [Rhizoclosmatium globosum]|eukprot:ORY53641.1 hypothetical protein BCR33DRAFT_654798 [Rhizoclosmatium globosum]
MRIVLFQLVLLAATLFLSATVSADFSGIVSPALLRSWQVPAADAKPNVYSSAATAISNTNTNTNADAVRFANLKDVVPVATNNTNPLSTLTSPLDDGISRLTAYTAVYAAVLIASGLALVFFGHKLFKPLLFLAGFYFFSVLTFVVLQNIEFSSKSQIGGSNRDLVYFCVCLLFGLIGGGLTLALWKVGFFAIGAGLGYVLSLLFLTVLKDVITSSTARIITIVVFCLVFGVLVFFLEMPILITATSFGGAYATFVGLDVFAQTGFVDISRIISTGKNVQVDFGSKWAYMFAGCVLLAIIGLCVQVHQLRQAKWKHTGLMHRDFARAGHMSKVPAPHTAYNRV